MKSPDGRTIIQRPNDDVGGVVIGPAGSGAAGHQCLGQTDAVDRVRGVDGANQMAAGEIPGADLAAETARHNQRWVGVQVRHWRRGLGRTQMSENELW